MSKGIKIKYNNDVILDYPSDIELKLPTNGKYMESDIDIEVNRDNSGTVNITQNGTASVDGYASANVNVPNSYSASDEGKVVDNGALVAQTSTTKTANGTYDTTLNNQIVVDVEGGGAKNILFGTDAPNASVGNNGDIYLQYDELHELPTGYTQIEYIESTGTQYIDTLVTPDQDTSLEIEFSMNALSGDKGIYGSRVSGSSRDFETHFYGSANVYVGYNSNTDIKSAWGALQTYEKYKVYHNKNLYYKNGSLIKTFSAATFTCPYDLTIFGVRNNSANPTWLCSAKLYRFKMWNDETLVRDMIPIKDNNDVVCLYDLVSETCFYNAGSGNFNAGGNAFEYIKETYCKVNGSWQALIGTDIDDVNTGE